MKLTFIVPLFATTLLAQSRPATTQLTAFDELASAWADVKDRPIVKLDSIADAVLFKMSNGNLVVQTTAKPTENIARLDVADLPGVNTIRIQGAIRDGKPDWLELIHRTADAKTFTLSSVIVSPGRLQVTRGEESADDTQLLSVELMQSEQNAAEGEPRVTLYVKLIKDDATTSKTPVDLRLTAASIDQLRREHPAEVLQYLEPIFRELKQETVLARVDSRIAWQVFADAAKINDETKSQVSKLIAQLDAEDFQKRESATKQLEKLGQSAALALMRLPRAKLSEEQKNRIETFLAPYQPLTAEQVDQLRRSPQFLIDCLYDEDRDLTAAVIEQLNKITHRRIDFDLTTTGQSRVSVIRALRASLPATTQSTTQRAPSPR